MLHHFGVRHHGPGCARSLLRAFEALRPDCVLIEGPPECNDLLPLANRPDMQPPVALLSYCPDEPQLACFHPFAEFSPEWQAIRWAVSAGAPVRFIDLPRVHDLALRKAADDAKPQVLEEGADPADTRDPLDGLARAAGYGDGESWWNHMVEERGDGVELFEAIAEAMVTLRNEGVAPARPPAEQDREALREAHMRQCQRQALKEGFERVAVVCGAWHLAALQADVTIKADAALLKGLPKLKVQTTWVPWTYRHLTQASGYGAGVRSPGWYEHLWRHEGPGETRGAAWLSRVAKLMRERDLDCSSAHLIEATRLADSLAALRQRPAPGLDELHEASRAVLSLGDDALLRFIDDALVVGDRLGQVPPDVPTVPLQRDLEQAQKSLRLKPEALQKTLDLDLRQPNDLARSHLLHRLQLLGLPWGVLSRVGRSSRGSFHEVWVLQWQPEFALRLIEASQWGQTVPLAATARVAQRAAQGESLADLAALVDSALLADLPDAVVTATQALESRAALSGDTPQLLAALPPLANVFRYGNVRGTDAQLVAHVVDGLIVRAAIGLPLAACQLDDEAAETLRATVLAAHAAVGLRDAEAQTAAWRQALGQLAAMDSAHPLLQGLAARLQLDAGEWDSVRVAQAMSLHLSVATEPAKAAAWLGGFLNQNAMVLLHDPAVWQLLDDWLCGLGEDHFVRVLPLVRRSFAGFGPSERRDLGQRAAQGGVATPVASTDADWEVGRANTVLPLLRQLMGLTA